MSFISVFTLVLTAITIFVACHTVYTGKIQTEIKQEAILISNDFEAEEFSALLKQAAFPDKSVVICNAELNSTENYGNTDIFPGNEFPKLVATALENGEAEHSEYSFRKGESRYSYYKKLKDGRVLCITAKTYDTYMLMAGALFPVIIIAFLIYVLSSIISARLTENIVKPIEEINPFDDEYDNVYTEIKPFLDRISNQNKRIKEQMKTLSETEKIRREFSANVSHELKTPLTSIHGYAQLINSGMAKVEDIPEFTRKIEKETKRLISLTEDITKLSKLDENAEPTSKEKIDLKEIAEEVKEKLLPMADERDIDFDVLGESFYIEANYNQITELIYNLCENAIKYNKENGSVRVIVSENVVKVKDTGIGIPEEDKNRIFERFFRVDKSHSKLVNGTGLGLSIVKHIALINKADIQVESVLGEGTEFTIVFNN